MKIIPKGVEYIPHMVHTKGMFCKHTNIGMLCIPVYGMHWYYICKIYIQISYCIKNMCRWSHSIPTNLKNMVCLSILRWLWYGMYYIPVCGMYECYTCTNIMHTSY